jgi:hypothetical protein
MVQADSVVHEVAMTEAAGVWLATFAQLSAQEQQEVVAEIVRRATEGGDLPEAALHEMATELFQSYDAEEAYGRC